MQRYDTYKDSGVKWLGEIPSHWEVLALKHILKSKKVLVGKHSSQYELLSLTLKGVVKRDMDNPEGKFPASFDTYQAVEPNDFIFCNFDNEETPRAVGLSPYKGMITGAYDVLSRKNPKLTDKYLIYYFLYIDDAKRFKPLYKGLRKTVPFDSFMSYKIPVPSIKEQNAIVSYLDTATAKIDAAIAQQQKMIDLLNERKQIIINRAVTKGLNPNARMKDSGVEWIGEVPEGWEVRRVKSITSKVGSGVTPRGGGETYVDKGVMFLRSQNIYFEGFKLDDVAFITDAVDASMSNTRVKVGDVLFNITGGSIGRCYYVPEGFPKANVNQHVSIIRPYNFPTEYLYYLLRSHMSRVQVDIQQTGGNREGLTAFALKNFVFPIPPETEQKMIIHYLNDVDMKLEQTIQNCQKKISLLQERKQIIINEVVTGKVKVL